MSNSHHENNLLKKRLVAMQDELDKYKTLVESFTDEEQAAARAQAQADQAITKAMNDTPMLWWGLFSRMVDQGFNKEQALDLLKAFISKPTG